MSNTGKLVRSEQRLHWGAQSLEMLRSELQRFGVSRPTIVCGHSVYTNHKLFDQLVSQLDALDYSVFPRVEAQSPLEAVSAATDTLSSGNADSIIAVGGGSAMVTARAASILLAEGRRIEPLSTWYDEDGAPHSPRLTKPKVPIFAIPTTPTTASVKAGSAVQERGHHGRYALYDPKTRAKAIFLVPNFLRSAPDHVGRAAALNTLSMGVEGLLSQRSSFFSDASLSYASNQCIEILQQPAETRPWTSLDMQFSALAVGEGTDIAGGGMCAALSHTIGRQYNTANGEIDAILLPHVLQYEKRYRADNYRRAEQLVGRGDDLPQKLRQLFEYLKAPKSLREIGVRQSDLSALAEEAMTDFAVRGDSNIETEQLLEVLRAAF